MKRIDSKSAEDASPVEISIRIIDALIDAVKSQEGEIIITFKKDLKGIGDPFIGTVVRIEYGGCNTFIETWGNCKNLHDVSNLTGVFRYLSKALARWEEVERNEVQIYLDNEHKAAWKQAEETRKRVESARTGDAKY